MKRLLLLSVLTMPVFVAFGQKIQGTYVGAILSERNVLVLEADGGKVTGAVFINQNQRFSFNGTYNKPELKGDILLDDGRKISMEGKLKASSLSLAFPDSSEIRTHSIHKVSTRADIDMADLFSDRYDMALLGVWETFMRTDARGNDITTSGKIINHYDFHGRGTGRLSGTPPIPANRSYTPGSIPPQYFRWEITWETHDGLLVATEDHAPPGSTLNAKVHYTLGYSIKNDTLVTRNPNTNLTYWKRSR